MKTILLSSALLAALTLPSFAGTDMAPNGPTDTKSMKDMKQMNQTEESDAGFYVGVYGGAQFSTDYGNNHQVVTGNATGASLSSHSTIHSDWGGVGGIKAGYNFQSQPLGHWMGLRLQPAVEAEALYIGDESHASNAFFAGENERFSTNSGDFLINGILRFKNDSIVTPYVGIGAGIQYITAHGELSGPAGTVTGLDVSDTAIAVQGLFGFDVKVCQHVCLFTEYKFIDDFAQDAKNSNVGVNTTYRFKPDQIQQNLITAGVKYAF